MTKVETKHESKLISKACKNATVKQSGEALEGLYHKLSSYALERFCKALENEGNLIDALNITRLQKQDLHALLDKQLQQLHQGELVSPQQTLNKLVALGESAAAAEAVREISKTLKQLNCKVRKVLPLECKANWDELMACTGEALVERHLLVD